MEKSSKWLNSKTIIWILHLTCIFWYLAKVGKVLIKPLIRSQVNIWKLSGDRQLDEQASFPMVSHNTSSPHVAEYKKQLDLKDNLRL